MTSAATLGAAAAGLALLAACQRSRPDRAAPPEPTSGPASSSSIGPPSAVPAPRQGMVYIPRGALVAGTPPDRLPRIADEEMPGEQLIMQGFYIDLYPYPNEEGAIPLTNVNQPEAAALCAERGKRLCTELEWERACKGPDNHVYEYGDDYHANRCGTGSPAGLRPSGLLVGCTSDFGVRDLHGGAFEWTSSPWNRGTRGELRALRGGNGTAGEIVGRCANGQARAPDRRMGNVGLRCCAGPENTAEVVLSVHFGKKLELQDRISPDLAARLLGVVPEAELSAMAERGKPGVERFWVWRPIGNEELLAASVCAGLHRKPRCGVVVARDYLGRASFVAWAPSGHSSASLHVDRDARDLWLLGGDTRGLFKRLIEYAWGRVTVHGEDRRIGKVAPTKPEKP